MGKMESAFRAEIARLARKEINAEVRPLSKQVLDLKKQIRTLRKAAASAKAPADAKPANLELPPQAEVEKTRIGPRWIKALRKRNKISQQQLADLVGVSMSAVCTWEYGRAKPGGENKAKLVALRGMSKPEVTALVGGKAAPEKTGKTKPKKKKKAAKPKKKARKKTAKPKAKPKKTAKPKPKATAKPKKKKKKTAKPKKKPVKKKAAKPKKPAKKKTAKSKKNTATKRTRKTSKRK